MEDRIIPHSGCLYAVAIESPHVKNMHSTENIALCQSHQWTPYRDNYAKLCKGGFVPSPIHWNQLQAHDSQSSYLTSPENVCNISFHEIVDIETE